MHLCSYIMLSHMYLSQINVVNKASFTEQIKWICKGGEAHLKRVWTINLNIVDNMDERIRLRLQWIRAFLNADFKCAICFYDNHWENFVGLQCIQAWGFCTRLMMYFLLRSKLNKGMWCLWEISYSSYLATSGHKGEIAN